MRRYVIEVREEVDGGDYEWLQFDCPSRGIGYKKSYALKRLAAHRLLEKDGYKYRLCEMI